MNKVILFDSWKFVETLYEQLHQSLPAPVIHTNIVNLIEVDTFSVNYLHIIVKNLQVFLLNYTFIWSLGIIFTYSRCRFSSRLIYTKIYFIYSFPTGYFLRYFVNFCWLKMESKGALNILIFIWNTFLDSVYQFINCNIIEKILRFEWFYKIL